MWTQIQIQKSRWSNQLILMKIRRHAQVSEVRSRDDLRTEVLSPARWQFNRTQWVRSWNFGWNWNIGAPSLPLFQQFLFHIHISGEQPIFTCKAHVFHIDPKTKRSWISASNSAVPVSFFYDSSRALYRIISVEGTKAVINSTITPNMTFTKTSQKFGQWSDVRANTVYGLGFGSEGELNKFIEKFAEVKEATSRAGGGKANGGGTGKSFLTFVFVCCFMLWYVSKWTRTTHTYTESLSVGI